MSAVVLAVCLIISVQCNKAGGQPACKNCTADKSCPSGCIDGYWGDGCYYKCPDNCVSCSQNFGEDNSCTQCKKGYYNGYGYTNCSHPCRDECKTCIDYNNCNECISGSYGQSCQSKCSRRCVKDVCFKESGICSDGCETGYTGESCNSCDTYNGFTYINGRCSNCTINCANCSAEGFCIECKNTYTGNYCMSSCPNNCLNRACNLDGRCQSCGPGFYGDYCNIKCPNGYYLSEDASYSYKRCKRCPNTCLDSECDGANGECIKGCVHKKWGLTCPEDCPINCLKCSQSSGNCSLCERGKYLANCSESCSTSCNKTNSQLLCAIENGACLNGCLSMNKYGTYCEKNCSNNCKDNVCSWLTGDCIEGCQNNHWGKQCEHVCNENCKPIEGATTCDESNGHCLSGCIEGHYSVQCNKTCSVNCLNTSCDISGKCLHGCSGEFMDDFCLQVKYGAGEKSHIDAAKIGGLVGGALVLTVIVFVAAVALYKGRRGSEQNIEGNHGNNTVVYSNIENRPQNSATGISAAYEMIGRRDELAEYSALSGDTNQSAAFLDVGSRSSDVANQPIQTIYEKPMLEEDIREYAALEYDTSKTSDENLHGNKDKIQNQSLTLGKGTARRDSADNIINTGACSSDEKTTKVREEEHAEYINTNLSGVSQAKKYS